MIRSSQDVYNTEAAGCLYHYRPPSITRNNNKWKKVGQTNTSNSNSNCSPAYWP